ncbi:permease [Rhizocola hellebori]|uniref:Permease n=1 Tax=Rhizocola hellebori TaxID=1392758 RepID=A0A8J3VGB8_9ACTN|nr:EamA family transporter [Rhizocola hellebori]GIH04977.1 permease [Rhizocola hellebori]
MPFRPRPALGVSMVAVAALLFAINGSVSKVILQAGIQARDLTTFRAAGSCLALLIAGVILRPGPTRFRVTVRELPLLLAFGVIGYFVVPMLYFVGLSRLPVGIALLLQYTAPLFVALWARFGRRQQVRPRLWIGFGLSLAGLAIVADVGGALKLDALGVAAALLCALLFALYFLLGERQVANRDAISVTAWGFGVAALAGLLTRGAGGRLPDWSSLAGTTAGGTPIWLLCIYLIIGGSVCSYALIAASLRHLPPTSVGMIAMLEPVLGSAVAWIALGESLTATQLVGGVVLLAGVGLAETARVGVRHNESHAPIEDTVLAPQRHSSPAKT